MRIFLNLLILGFLLILSPVANAQKRKKDKGDEQTVENAQARKAAQKAEIQAKYDGHREHIKEIQTKKTQKRMKKSLKKAQKLSQGKSVPWYKRMFRKRRI
ncbi:MAG: hypothetical protein R2809_06545 [Flavobacteriales bacterium]